MFARRKELLDYALEINIDFVTDSSNATNDYTRNLFRNEILNSIENVYPEASVNVLKNIERFADVEYLYNKSIELIKQKLIEKREDKIQIPILKLLKTKPLHSIIYEIIKDYGFAAAQVQDVEKLLYSASGKFIKSASHRILNNRKWLIISPLINTELTFNVVIEDGVNVIDFNGGQLLISKIIKLESPITEATTAYINSDDIIFPLILRKWKTGDYFYPLGMNKKKKLSRFFIDQKFSLLQKEQVWILESNKKIIWVVGYRIDDRFKITVNSTQILKLNLTQKIQKH